MGHMILLGHAHPEPLVHSAALHCGFTVVQPSQYFHPRSTQGGSHWGMSGRSYGVEELKRDLRAVYTSAGVKVCGGLIHIESPPSLFSFLPFISPPFLLSIIYLSLPLCLPLLLPLPSIYFSLPFIPSLFPPPLPFVPPSLSFHFLPPLLQERETPAVADQHGAPSRRVPHLHL